MIPAMLRRSSKFLLVVPILVAGFGVGMVPTGQVDAAAPRAAIKVLAKEVNGRYVFASAKIKVKVGQAVVWKNSTDAPHTVTSTTKGWTYDKQLNTGASLRFTFKKAGTFHYKCSFHPGMVGTVIVIR